MRSKQLTASIEASGEIILRGSERWAYLSAHRRQRNIRARSYFPDRRSRLSRGFPWLVVTLKPLIRKKETTNPPPSYANCSFYGIHTFKFVNRDNKVTMVRFRFVPQDGEKQLSDAEQKSMPRDFLEKTFIDRTHQGPVRWDMLVTIGQPGDSEDDPTILWPNNRKEVRAGTLTLSSAMPDPKAGSYKINFDPLMMADGIEATNDPILLFRSPSYAVSHTRRLRDL